MIYLLIGLLLFLGAHSVRIVADDWRARQIEQGGLKRWKGLYTLVSIVGLVLVVWGYGQARLSAEALWATPTWTRHAASLLTLLSFILIAAAYVPGNALKAKVGHPMVLGVKVWALAHLLANNISADLLLFGAFLVWAVLSFRAARRRDRLAGTVYTAAGAGPTVTAVLIGAVAWAGFAFWGHGLLIGVRPFG